METFSSYITEQKNTHMTHIEDKVLYGGVKDARNVRMDVITQGKIKPMVKI